MLTPADLEDFARGFCLSERLIPDSNAIDGVRVLEFAEHLRVDLKALRVNASTLRAQQRRTLRIGISCGLCGHLDLKQVRPQISAVVASAARDFATLQRALAPAAKRPDAECAHARCACGGLGRSHRQSAVHARRLGSS